MDFVSISLKGFLSYYKDTSFDFAEETTIIIGLNNTGKSKLFDAINWAMYERVYDSDKKKWIIIPDQIAELILNKRSKKEALEAKDKTEALVRVQLHADSYPDQLITIERKYVYDYTLGLDKLRYDRNMCLTFQDELDGETKTFTGSEAEQRITSLCSLRIRDFVLFKGEMADDLMQLSQKNQTAIMEAVREISRLDLFEKATEIANRYQKSKFHALTRIKSSNEQTEKRKAELENEQKKYEDLVSTKEKERDTLELSVEKLTTEIAKQRAFLSSQEALAKLFAEKDELNNRKTQLNNQLKNYKEINKTISDTWVFYKVKSKIKSFAEFYNQLELRGHVPAPISQDIIKKSLLHHKCALCSQDLLENSVYYNEVKKKEQNEFIDDLGKDLSNLNFVFNSKTFDIENVPEAIDSYIEEKNKQEDSRRFIQKQLEAVENKIKEVQISESDEQKKQELEIKRRILAENEGALKKEEQKLNNVKGQITAYEAEVSQRKKEILNLVNSSGKIDVTDKVKLYYSTKVRDAMNRVCEAVQNLAYSEIEQTANDYYHEMVSKNPALTGDVKIDKTNSEIYSVDSYGNQIKNINEGNRIAIQLAVAAGLLTVAGTQFRSCYPFVTDAPTSNMDAINKSETIKCMIDAFEQSIIIVKDDSLGQEDPLYSLIRESKGIQRAYKLVINPAESGLIEDQYTERIVIK